MAAETERLFFALWPPTEVTALLEQQLGAALDGIKGRRVATERLHVTLAFLGDTRAEQRVCVEAAAARVHVEPFTLMLDRLGYFARPQVVWLGNQESPQTVGVLVGDLNAGLRGCGCAIDTRPFRTHITVMRKGRRKPDLPAIDPVRWDIESFVLVRSELRPEGAHYEVVRRWAL